MTGEISKVKILVVEDEFIVAKDIARRLEVMQYEVVGIAQTVQAALKLIQQHPDLDILLIDIILKGSHDGIELARIINETYGLPFIFLTSHADHHLVDRAKSVRPYAYILKPFNDRQISVSLELALVNFSKKTPEKDLLAFRKDPKKSQQVVRIKESLFLKKDNHFERVMLPEILFLEADSNYTVIHTQCGRFLYSTVLKKIESLLAVDFFLRVHRSFVININCVTGFEGNLLFIGTHKIPVSKSHRDEVFTIFRKI